MSSTTTTPTPTPDGYRDAGPKDSLVVLSDGTTMSTWDYIRYLEATLDAVRSQLRALAKGRQE